MVEITALPLPEGLSDRLDALTASWFVGLPVVDSTTPRRKKRRKARKPPKTKQPMTRDSSPAFQLVPHQERKHKRIRCSKRRQKALHCVALPSVGSTFASSLAGAPFTGGSVGDDGDGSYVREDAAGKELMLLKSGSTFNLSQVFSNSNHKYPNNATAAITPGNTNTTGSRTQSVTAADPSAVDVPSANRQALVHAMKMYLYENGPATDEKSLEQIIQNTLEGFRGNIVPSEIHAILFALVGASPMAVVTVKETDLDYFDVGDFVQRVQQSSGYPKAANFKAIEEASRVPSRVTPHLCSIIPVHRISPQEPTTQVKWALSCFHSVPGQHTSGCSLLQWNTSTRTRPSTLEVTSSSTCLALSRRAMKRRAMMRPWTTIHCYKRARWK